jgi:hypothetical protein
MLLSAMIFAAALQAAPVAVAQEGYLVPDRPAAATQSLDQLVLPLPRTRATTAAKAQARAMRFAPSTRRHDAKTLPPLQKPTFVRDPQMVGCDPNKLQRAGDPEALKVQPLSKMPRAHGERAVARLVDGCPVAVMIAQR